MKHRLVYCVGVCALPDLLVENPFVLEFRKQYDTIELIMVCCFFFYLFVQKIQSKKVRCESSHQLTKEEEEERQEEMFVQMIGLNLQAYYTYFYIAKYSLLFFCVAVGVFNMQEITMSLFYALYILWHVHNSHIFTLEQLHRSEYWRGCSAWPLLSYLWR